MLGEEQSCALSLNLTARRERQCHFWPMAADGRPAFALPCCWWGPSGATFPSSRSHWFTPIGSNVRTKYQAWDHCKTSVFDIVERAYFAFGVSTSELTRLKCLGEAFCGIFSVVYVEVRPNFLFKQKTSLDWILRMRFICVLRMNGIESGLVWRHNQQNNNNKTNYCNILRSRLYNTFRPTIHKKKIKLHLKITFCQFSTNAGRGKAYSKKNVLSYA